VKPSTFQPSTHDFCSVFNSDAGNASAQEASNSKMGATTALSFDTQKVPPSFALFTSKSNPRKGQKMTFFIDRFKKITRNIYLKLNSTSTEGVLR
jgi:hypothetical protein